jgi:hypothetical protein
MSEACVDSGGAARLIEVQCMVYDECSAQCIVYDECSAQCIVYGECSAQCIVYGEYSAHYTRLIEVQCTLYTPDRSTVHTIHA